MNILVALGTAQGAVGTVRLVVEDVKRTRTVLDEGKLVYQENGGAQHELANKPGALAQHLEKLAAKGVNMSSILAAGGNGRKTAVVVYIVNTEAKATPACL